MHTYRAGLGVHDVSARETGSDITPRWFLWIAVVIGWLGFDIASAVAATTRTLDLVTFSAPAGWNVEEKSGGIGKHVVLSRTTTTSYCMVVIYSGTPASSDLNASFAAEWKSVALQTIDAVPTPDADIMTVGDTRAAFGGANSKAGGQPCMAMLLVLDAGSSVVSMLVLSSSAESFATYNAEVQDMLSTFVVKRVAAPPPSSAPAMTDGGRLVIPPPTRRLVIADLAGEWGMSDGINTTYVYRDSGNYAGTDSLHFRETWVITADGTVSLDFFGIRNGQKIVEKSKGTVTLSADGILSIKMTNEQRYVLRGWLVAPTMTVMKLNGPWYADGIPADILSNPEQGANLDKKWVRLNKTK